MTKNILFLIPAAMWLTGCSEAPNEKSAASSLPIVAVSTATATTETWPSIYEATGTVRARTSAVISAKLMGYVREVKVQTGDRVREGQIVDTENPVRIENEGLGFFPECPNYLVALRTHGFVATSQVVPGQCQREGRRPKSAV